MPGKEELGDGFRHDIFSAALTSFCGLGKKVAGQKPHQKVRGVLGERKLADESRGQCL